MASWAQGWCPPRHSAVPPRAQGAPRPVSRPEGFALSVDSEPRRLRARPQGSQAHARFWPGVEEMPPETARRVRALSPPCPNRSVFAHATVRENAAAVPSQPVCSKMHAARALCTSADGCLDVIAFEFFKIAHASPLPLSAEPCCVYARRVGPATPTARCERGRDENRADRPHPAAPAQLGQAARISHVRRAPPPPPRLAPRDSPPLPLAC